MGPAAAGVADVPALENVHVVRFIVNNIESKTVTEFWDGLRDLICDDANDPAVIDGYLTQWAVSARLVSDKDWRRNADAGEPTGELPRSTADLRRASHARRAARKH